jgi:predicted acetyltransferase
MTRDHVVKENEDLFNKLLENGRERFTQEPFAAKITLEEGEKEVKIEYN